MRFDNIEIDTDRYVLLRDGETVSVEPKVFDLIRFLAENANRLVTKDDLIETVWHGRIVSDSALSTAVKSARKALGEAGKRIATVRGRGFRLEIQDVAPEPAMPVATPGVDYREPRFAVLPPQGMDEAAGHAMHVLSRAMARVPFLDVVAPAAILSMDDTSPRAIAAEIAPGFLLDLNCVKIGGRRLNCTLFDAETVRSIWSHECDAGESDLDIDTVLRDVAARVEPHVVRAMAARIAQSGPSNPRGLVMEALGTMALRGWNAGAFASAESSFERAIAMDDRLAEAHAGFALVLGLGPAIGMSEQTEARVSSAISHADRALDLDDMSPAVLGLAGCALCDSGQSVRGRTILERALELDGDNPQALAALGAQLLRDGEVEASIKHLESALEKVPRNNVLAVWGSVLALALLKSGQPDRATEIARRAVAADDRSHLPRITLGAVHLVAGNSEAALKAFSDALRITPDLREDQAAAAIGGMAARGLFQLREAAGS